MEDLTDIHLAMPWGQTIEFPPHRPLAHGMRLSTHCPVQRVAEFMDEDLDTPFDPGVGAIGHLYAFLWAHQTRRDGDQLEVPIPWQHGVAHLDRLLEGEIPCEVKTSSDRDPKPKRENVAQSMRYLLAAEEAGLPFAGEPWRIIVIGKAGNESGWVRGPWEVTLDDDAPVDTEGDPITGREYAAWDQEATGLMLERAQDFLEFGRMEEMLVRPDLVGDLCSCGQHRLPPPVRLDDPKLAEQVSTYKTMISREKESAGTKKESFAAIGEMLAAMDPGRYEIGGVNVTKGENGRLTIR